MACFDSEKLVHLCEGNHELVGSLINLYTEQWPVMVAELRLANQESRQKDLVRTAHTLKGTGKNFFSPQVIDAAYDIEKNGYECDEESIGKKIDVLEPLLKQLEEELLAYKSKSGNL